MSGGSYDYVSHKIEEAASGLRDRHPNQPHVVALSILLDRIAAVMHDIEWADSCDTSWDEALDESIRAVISPDSEVVVAVDMAEHAKASLIRALERAAREAPNPFEQDAAETFGL